MEIEKKFLVNENIEKLDLKCFEKNEIEQYYIALNPQIRIRKEKTKCYLTLKNGNGLVREEYEHEVDTSIYNAFFKSKIGIVVHKTRYKIPLRNNLVAELDIYHDELEGLKIIEIEYENIEQAINFKELPDYFAKEVTEDTRYKNLNLALDGSIPKD